MSSTITTITTTTIIMNKKDFLANGFTLTINDTSSPEPNCAICTRPLYISPPATEANSTCATASPSHTHTMACDPSHRASIAPINNEVPQPGIKITVCGHVLGYSCALTWFKEHNTCPFCRTVVYEKRAAVRKVEWESGHEAREFEEMRAFWWGVRDV
jgi:hypothetical protein